MTSLISHGHAKQSCQSSPHQQLLNMLFQFCVNLSQFCVNLSLKSKLIHYKITLRPLICCNIIWSTAHAQLVIPIPVSIVCRILRICAYHFILKFSRKWLCSKVIHNHNAQKVTYYSNYIKQTATITLLCYGDSLFENFRIEVVCRVGEHQHHWHIGVQNFTHKMWS